MLTLRPYQVDLVGHARAELKAGCKRLLIQAPTGSGKTCLVAHLLANAAAKGLRSWFCVHRRELVEQSVQTFTLAADIHTGIIAAGSPADHAAPVQVCSIPSLTRRLSRLRLPDLVIWDECHHLPSRTWSETARALPSAYHIGLTATPQRLDGRGLGAHFDRLLLGPTVAALIADGYLSPYRLFAPSSIDTSEMHRTAGDYNKAEVATAMGHSTVVGDAVAHYQQHCAGGRALVFVWSLAASRALAKAFIAAGIPAAHVDGETNKHERQRAMAALRAGDILVICNVDLFCEGLDVPALDAVFLLRPTDSLGLYLQQCGRGLRPSPGKTHVKIFDHVGNWTRHGLPDDPREWSLEDRKKKTTAEPSARRCPQCFACSPVGAEECVECGSEFPHKPRKITHIDGPLVEADLAALRSRVKEFEQECRTLQDWQNLAKKMGYAAGWAWYRWRARRSVGYAKTSSLYGN